MTEMPRFPPAVTPNAPAPSLNTGSHSKPAENSAPVTYPPNSPGYPPPTYSPPAEGYAPAGGYPPPVGGYPPPGGYPPHGGYTPLGAYPPGVVINQPGYPPAGYPPGANYLQPGMQPPVVPNWMPMPAGTLVCPPGLEYLAAIDQLLVHQKVEILEVLTGFETENEYSILNSLGQLIYTAREDSDCCSRNCCGPLRTFEMNIRDNAGNEIIHLNRPCACGSCCCPCCLQGMEVMSPPGMLIGSIVQDWSIIHPQFRVLNASGETVLRIEGPFCTFSMGRDVEFKVLSKDGKTKVGAIRKQWTGLVRELYTDADNFGITFPLELDVNTKAVLLGACILIDFMYYEDNANNRNNR